MSRARYRLMLTAIGATGAILPGQTVLAQIKTVPSATISLGGGYSTNPFLSANSDTSAASLQLNVQPSLELIDDTTQAVISANYNRTEYASKYGGNDGYGASFAGSSQLNSRLSLNLSAGYDSQILGTAGGFAVSPVVVGGTTGTTIDGTTTGVPVATPVTPILTTPVIGGIGGDVGLIGLRQRRETLSASAGGTYRPDERSTWDAGVSVSRNNYPNNGGLATNFRTYGVNTAYTRSLSETTSVGIQLAGTIVQYSNIPTSKFLTPRLTYHRLLSEKWTLDLAVGGSIVDDGVGNGTRVAVSATGSLCRAGERGRLCISAAREPSVGGFGGTRNQTSVSATYSYQVSEATSLSATGSYQRIGSGGDVVGLPFANRAGNQDYLSGDVTVSRRLSRRLSAYASGSYRDVNGLGVPVSADIGGRAGLSLAIGGRR